jgi:hypothetical protein
MNRPLFFLANNQLYIAVLAPPICNEPVGEGANLTLTFKESGAVEMNLAEQTPSHRKGFRKGTALQTSIDQQIRLF